MLPSESTTSVGPTRLKRLNRMAIVELVKRHPGISRAEVVERSGLTKSTVSVLVQGLIAEGWLREGASPTSSEIGRPRTPLTLDGATAPCRSRARSSPTPAWPGTKPTSRPSLMCGVRR